MGGVFTLKPPAPCTHLHPTLGNPWDQSKLVNEWMDSSSGRT